ncbi:hypothetical protein WICPIJ_007098 [Wickerhamomyces pijperi]|uniref:Uncharacterized protein n=1 Tax=Wickerhamomyces pijperi TaxID=599730 RepID=A0A9P8TKS2_WICPI|nr:hypothetical protein WICPIJ_007098 [Wickerhamomyces pijperi]
MSTMPLTKPTTTDHSSTSGLSSFDKVSSQATNFATESDVDRSASVSADDEGGEEEEDDENNWSIIFTDDNFSGVSEDEEVRSNFSDGDIDVMNDIISETSSDLETTQAGINTENINHSHTEEEVEVENEETIESERHFDQDGVKHETLESAVRPELSNEDSISTLKPVDDSTLDVKEDCPQEHLGSITEVTDDSNKKPEPKLSVEETAKESIFYEEPFSKDDTPRFMKSILKLSSSFYDSVRSINPAYLILFVYVLFDFIANSDIISSGTEFTGYPSRIGVVKPTETAVFMVPEPEKQGSSDDEDTTWTLIGKLGNSIWHDIEHGIQVTEDTIVEYNGEYLEKIGVGFDKLKNQEWAKTIQKDLGLTYEYLAHLYQEEKKRIPVEKEFFGKLGSQIGEAVAEEYSSAQLFVMDTSGKIQAFYKRHIDTKPVLTTLHSAQVGLARTNDQIQNYLQKSSKHLKSGAFELYQSMESAMVPQSQKAQAVLSKWGNQASQSAFKLVQDGSKKFQDLILSSSSSSTSAESAPQCDQNEMKPVIFKTVEEFIEWLDISITRHANTPSQPIESETEHKYVIMWDDRKMDCCKKSDIYKGLKKALEDYYAYVFKGKIDRGLVGDLEIEKMEFLLSTF